ncbi:MAG: hypothetical protein MR210_04400, partial [Erysipelotrichaceae bacterium]|nr:hypothetical protein [Erysipelotrichaceae bacterium]
MKKKNHNLIVVITSSFLLLIFAFMIYWSTILVRNKILQNADSMGTYLVQSYATEETNILNMYKIFIKLGSLYIDEYSEQGMSPEEIHRW